MPSQVDGVLERSFGFCLSKSKLDPEKVSSEDGRHFSKVNNRTLSQQDLGPFTKFQARLQTGSAEAGMKRLRDLCKEEQSICRTSFPDDESYAECISVNLFRFLAVHRRLKSYRIAHW